MIFKIKDSDNEFRKARKNAGLTLQEVEMYFSIPYATLQTWESGRRKPPEYVKRLYLEKINSIKKVVFTNKTPLGEKTNQVEEKTEEKTEEVKTEHEL